MTETVYPISILKALAEVRAKVPSVPKTGRNLHFNYDFSSESDVLGAYNPAMTAAGLLILPSVEEIISVTDKGLYTIRMAFTLAHAAGAVWPCKLPWVAQGQDTQDKGVAKAITSGTKYFLTSLFQAEKGTDPDHDDGKRDGATKPPPPISTAGPSSSQAPAILPAAPVKGQPWTLSSGAICPACHKPAIRKGAEKYGGGHFCSKKEGGCGVKFPATPAPASPPPPAVPPPAVSGAGQGLSEQDMREVMVQLATAGEKSVKDLETYVQSPGVKALFRRMNADQQMQLTTDARGWKDYHGARG